MVMMSFTSEMHLPQLCQIGLIHTGKSVSVCVRVDLLVLSDGVFLQHLYPNISG